MNPAGRKPVIGVMGGGVASRHVMEDAYFLGTLIAENGWILLNGGRNSGVMDASARGARERGGITVGILPDTDTSQVSSNIDIPILTGMGHARNSINVLSSDVVVACRGGAGTLSEIALALKSGKPVILLDYPETPMLETLSPKGFLHYADSPEKAVAIISSLLK